MNLNIMPEPLSPPDWRGAVKIAVLPQDQWVAAVGVLAVVHLAELEHAGERAAGESA